MNAEIRLSKDEMRGAVRLRNALRLDLLYNPAGQQRAGVLALLLALPFRDHPAARGALATLRSRSFNTSPLLTGFVLGPLFRALEDASLGEKDGVKHAERTASVLAPALAALGDRFVFGAVQPMVSALVVATAVLLPHSWLPWVFGVILALHAALQAYWRRRAWMIGLEQEGAVLAFLRGRTLERWIERHRMIVHFASGAAVGGSVFLGTRHGGFPALLVLVAGFLAVALWARRREGGRHRAGVLVIWASVWAWLVP